LLAADRADYRARIMSTTLRFSSALALSLALCGALGCEDEQGTPGKPAASAAPAVTRAAPPEPKPAPVVSAPPPEPRKDCPEGSSGEGSFNKPCEADGTARAMDVKWTGKLTDTGPSFRVHNTSKVDIIYGKMAAYFYDKAGKQLRVKDEGASDKTEPAQWCAGKIFEGPMKADEKAVITFSCVKKEHVPEGTDAIQAEMQMVGFTKDGKTTEFYWRNSELTPDERPKAKK
jgi:hypothetical protein